MRIPHMQAQAASSPRLAAIFLKHSRNGVSAFDGRSNLESVR